MAATISGSPYRVRVARRHAAGRQRPLPGWDTVALDDLAVHIGTEKVLQSLQMFTTLLAQSLLVLKDYSIDFQRQRHEVHDLASVSGFLGFSHLFQSCLTLLAQNRSSVERRETVIAAMEDALTEARVYLAAVPPPH